MVMDHGWCSIICELLLAERCQWVREKITELSLSPMPCGYDLYISAETLQQWSQHCSILWIAPKIATEQGIISDTCNSI